MTSNIKIRDEVEVKEDVTVYRNGRFRMIHLDSPSQWCATLNVRDRPQTQRRFASSIYNGSSYVPCVITIGTDGTVKIANEYGAAISGAQYGFLINRTCCYYV